MDANKQKWIEEVLSSTDGMQRAASPNITENVLALIANNSYSITQVANYAFTWRMAAAILLLVSVNLVSIYSYKHNGAGVEQIQAYNAASVFGIEQNTNSDPGTIIFGN